MTTQAQGDFPELAMKPEVSFESSGLSPEEAERLAASFKPSWEFDDAPFTQATGLPHSDLEELEAGGVNSDVRRNMRVRDSERSQAVSAHAVPQRVQTNEPEVSVIIDRSITAPSEEPPRPPPPRHAHRRQCRRRSPRRWPPQRSRPTGSSPPWRGRA